MIMPTVLRVDHTKGVIRKNVAASTILMPTPLTERNPSCSYEKRIDFERNGVVHRTSALGQYECT